MERSKSRFIAAFSLLEVVVATAVFATAIFAIIGLMNPLSKNVSDVIDSETASRLADSIQAELSRIGWAQAIDSGFLLKLDPSSPNPIQLVANTRGDRVRLLLVESGSPPADNELNHATLPGIADRDRYFLITLSRVVAFNSANSGSLTVRARVEWPYQIAAGPATGTVNAHGDGADPFIRTTAGERQNSSYFFALAP